MMCVVCEVKEALKFGDTCGDKGCRDRYLCSGQGSVNCAEYVSYMRDCAEKVKKDEGARDEW